MKIIFDSEHQKEMFLNSMVKGFCPGELNLKNYWDCQFMLMTGNCRECWEQCGIEMEVDDGLRSVCTD